MSNIGLALSFSFDFLAISVFIYLSKSRFSILSKHFDHVNMSIIWRLRIRNQVNTKHKMEIKLSNILCEIHRRQYKKNIKQYELRRMGLFGAKYKLWRHLEKHGLWRDTTTGLWSDTARFARRLNYLSHSSLSRNHFLALCTIWEFENFSLNIYKMLNSENAVL